MKKLLLSLSLMIAIAAPAAFGQARVELGASAPLSVGYISNSGGEFSDIVTTIGELGILPIPEFALLLQAKLGAVKLGGGIKAQSAILFTLAYPVVQAELSLGNFSIDASLGGYYFGYFAIGDVYGLQQADIIIPDLSAWLGIGRKNSFRIGGGALGIVPTTFDLDALPLIAYAGMKIVLE